MNKIKIIIILFCVLFGCKSPQSKEISGHEGKTLPSFELLLMDSITRLNTTNIPSGQPFVLFYFNPFCPYCRLQTKEIIDNIKSLNSIRFYLLSNYSFGNIKDYYNHFHLNQYTNISVGQDNDAYFGNYFKAIYVPYIAIYTKDKRLKQVLVGKVSSSLIKDIALE